MTTKGGEEKEVIKVGTGRPAKDTVSKSKSSTKKTPRVKVESVCPDCALPGGKSLFKVPKPGMIDENTACPTCEGTGVVVS